MVIFKWSSYIFFAFYVDESFAKKVFVYLYDILQHFVRFLFSNGEICH
jgi:hypothetical protein